MRVFSKNVLIHLLWALFCEFPSFLPFLLWQCFCFFNLSRCHIQQTYCIVLKTFSICKKICLLLGLLFFWTNLDIAILPLILRMCFSSGLCIPVIYQKKKKKELSPSPQQVYCPSLMKLPSMMICFYCDFQGLNLSCMWMPAESFSCFVFIFVF